MFIKFITVFKILPYVIYVCLEYLYVVKFMSVHRKTDSLTTTKGLICHLLDAGLCYGRSIHNSLKNKYFTVSENLIISLKPAHVSQKRRNRIFSFGLLLDHKDFFRSILWMKNPMLSAGSIVWINIYIGCWTRTLRRTMGSMVTNSASTSKLWHDTGCSHYFVFYLHRHTYKPVISHFCMHIESLIKSHFFTNIVCILTKIIPLAKSKSW